MSLTSFIVSRNWASSFLRIVLTLVGIALGVAIVVAIYVMDYNTIQSRLLAQDPQRGWVDLEVHPIVTTRTAEEVREDLRSRAGVADAAAWRETRGFAQAGQKPVPLSVFGLAPLPANSFSHYVVNRGRDLEARDLRGDAGSVLLGPEAAHLLGVEVGDTLTLSEPPPTQRVECKDGELIPVEVPPGVEAFSQTVTVVGILAHQKLGKRDGGLVAVAPLVPCWYDHRTGAAQCAEGHEGPLCSVCAKGYVLNDYEGACARCDGNSKSSGSMMLVGIGGADVSSFRDQPPRDIIESVIEREHQGKVAMIVEVGHAGAFHTQRAAGLEGAEPHGSGKHAEIVTGGVTHVD